MMLIFLSLLKWTQVRKAQREQAIRAAKEQKKASKAVKKAATAPKAAPKVEKSKQKIQKPQQKAAPRVGGKR